MHSDSLKDKYARKLIILLFQKNDYTIFLMHVVLLKEKLDMTSACVFMNSRDFYLLQAFLHIQNVQLC